jgi:signal transduction histidine kinase
MGWVTLHAVQAERAEREARRRADRAEKVRLALWRMDSTMALFLAPESARPWSDFESFHPAEGDRGGRALVPSPTLVADDPMVLLRFQVEEGGRFSSPWVPEPAFEVLTASLEGAADRRRDAERRLAEVKARLPWSVLREAMAKQGAVLLGASQMRELQARTRGAQGRGAKLESPFRVFLGSWTPFWDGDRLCMARQVWVQDRERLQACWLDWEALKEVLMSTIRDLLPGADLAPAPPGRGDAPAQEGEGRLSSLPVRLVAGPAPVLPEAGSPARGVLAAGWAFALLGALAGGLVLVRATLQSERRGAFASAVAHELRTPLTTFRLYTDLLAKGMVEDPGEQAELHRTLASEAERLDHLVKNVLAYARLEAGREVSFAEVAAGELLDRLAPRLEARAAQGGLQVAWEIPEALRDRRLRTDVLMVEQILFNLVDNACKYAGGGRLRIALGAGAETLKVQVQDEGPGIPDAERARLFRPFEKIGPQEARRAPGVGLGLALCRRLARVLGGELVHEHGAPGAAFTLSLPASPAGS